MIIDSGAPVNTIPESQWARMEELWKKKELILYKVSRKCDRAIIAYATESPLQVVATFRAWAEVIGHAKPKSFQQFFVVRNASSALLGKSAAEEMKLLKVGVTVNSLAQNNGEKREEFPKIPGLQVKLDIDNEIVPSQVPNYRVPLALEESVNERLSKMERLGIIENAPETSKWISPMEVVMKGKQDYRIVIDMRRPNKAIRRAHYPLPQMKQFHPALEGARYFTKLDISSAYFHIELHPGSREVTTFMTSRGLKRYTRLMFGVNAAPEIFQRTMDALFRRCKGVINFMDDFLVYGKTEQELEEREREVLSVMKKNKLTLNKEKCKFKLTEVEFLGYTLDVKGIRPSEEKLDAVGNFREPKSAAELRSFLGLVTFISPYIRNFSTMTEPLRRMLKKDEMEKWSEEQDRAFNELKLAVKDNVRTQGFFKLGVPTKLYTDASPVGLGAVLVQQLREGEKDQIIAFASKSLTETEKRYPQTQREALALVWAIEKWHYYLLGHQFTVLTDHQALEYIYNGKYRDGKRAITRAEGWALRLSAFDFNVQYVAGEKNIADSLSRLSVSNDGAYKESNELYELGSVTLELHAVGEESNAITVEEIKNAAAKDEETLAVLKALQDGEWSEAAARYRVFEKELHVWKEVLMRGERIVLPKTLRSQAMRIAHVGHPGVVRMKRSLREKVWWPGIDDGVDRHAKSCMGCTMLAKDDPPEPMERTAMPKQPWDFVAIDFYSPKELDAIVLVLVDYYSRHVHCTPISKHDAEKTIAALERIFEVFGYPKRMKADNGAPFQSKEFSEWCKSKGIDLVHSIPYWAQQNGMVERMMKNLTRALAIGKIEGRPWRKSLSNFVAAYNKAPHSVTGVAPSNAMFNRVVRGLLPSCEKEFYRFDEDVRDLDAERKFKGKLVGDRKRHAQYSEIELGDEVLVHSKDTGKLKPRFDPSPYEVTNRDGSALTLKGKDGRITERNVAQVKRRWLENETVDVGAPESSGRRRKGMQGDLLKNFFVYFQLKRKVMTDRTRQSRRQ